MGEVGEDTGVHHPHLNPPLEGEEAMAIKMLE
jgi:hypothetical protein